MTSVRPVILSGGSGTRLWPLSTKRLPKQFVQLVGDVSLFGATLTRLDGLPGLVDPLVVTGAGHLDLVEAALGAAEVHPGGIIIEPTGRNTAPAVVAAALTADPDDVLVVLPSDHVIADREEFKRVVALAVEEARSGSIVTFGIVPSRPETGYGYIEAGEPSGKVLTVSRFKEKPDRAEAAGMIEDGRHYWNSGMFVFEARTLIEEAERYCPDIVAGVGEALPAEAAEGVIELNAAFETVESISIDHAVMEKTAKAVTAPLDAGWDDLGSYQALWGLSEKDDAGNALTGDAIVEEVGGSLIHATSRVVAVAGVEDLVVVETPEAVLVVPLDKAQMVRDLSARVQNR